MPEPIRDKSQMYDLLAAGRFGNTVPQYFSVEDWLNSGQAECYPVWGVRTLTAGGPCRLNCPASEVARTFREFEALGHAANISLMVDRVCRVLLWADLFDDVGGWRLYGVQSPPRGGSWRAQMPTLGREWSPLLGKLLLRELLTPGSYADLEALLECYPGHVVELSALDRCLGTVPGRNTVVWEVRPGDGSYERSGWKHY